MVKMNFGQKLKQLLGLVTDQRQFYDDLADILVESDVGAKTSYDLVEKLRETCQKNNIVSKEMIKNELSKIMLSLLIAPKFNIVHDQTSFCIVLGVNGVGKTTTIAKLANYFSIENSKNKIILAAGDTFRAAAIEQLKYHGEKLGIRVVAHEQGADPGAVIYDTITAAQSSQSTIIIADTAGRLHNKVNLIKELAKIVKIATSRIPENNIIKLLVIDATTGQNGLVQAKTFHEAVGVDGIILTKYDSTAKGGIIFAIQQELEIPVYFIGTGERYEDLRVFDPDLFLKDFLELNE